MKLAAVFRAWRLFRRFTVSSGFTTSPLMTVSNWEDQRCFVCLSGGQRNAAQQSRLIREPGPLNTQILDRKHANPFLHRLADGIEQQVVECGNTAAEYHHIGVQSGNHVGDADAEPCGYSSDR